jgi:methyl-accepting chemotaxis protein
MPELQNAPATNTLDLEQLFRFVVALRCGDFAARLPTDLPGRAGEIAVGLNRFMQDMENLTAEVTRISTEIKDGIFGGQAELSLHPGPWRNCVEALNVMEYHLTGQVRDMIKTAKLLAEGNLERRVTAPCQGETQLLKDALNAMLERLRSA